jgi:hypothetical protein
MDRIGARVREELARFGPAAGMAELVEAWPGAVGPGIAGNAWPRRLARDGTLHVAVSSSAWAFELGQLAPTILDRLREALGGEAPPALRFATGPLPERHPESAGATPTKRVEPGPAEREQALELVAAAGDGELRELLARAAAASLARAAADRDL